MQRAINNILNNYKNEISNIEGSNLNNLKNAEKGISISRKYIKQLRLLLREKEFDTYNDEINFFKQQKPYIYSRVKFYSKLYQFLLKRPQGSLDKQRKFIDLEIEKLQSDYSRNLDFVKYMREESSYLDKYYFLRGNDEVQLITDTSYYLTDDEFSTSHDNLVAKIMAYDLLVNHYQKLLLDLRFEEKYGKENTSQLSYYHKRGFRWTGTKTDLIELIYALQASGSIEDGTAAIKAMVNACEELFELQLGNGYRTYLEIKERKKDKAKFLDKLKYALIKKMEKDDY